MLYAAMKPSACFLYMLRSPLVSCSCAFHARRPVRRRMTRSGSLRRSKNVVIQTIMRNITDLHALSDDDLLARLSRIAGQSRHVTADLVAHIGEVDRRRLFAREATSSMFGYCTEVLHLSEYAAYLRIAVARAARTHPGRRRHGLVR